MKKLVVIAVFALAGFGPSAERAFAGRLGCCCKNSCYCKQYNAFSPFCCYVCGPCCATPCFQIDSCPSEPCWANCDAGACPGGCCGAPVAPPSTQPPATMPPATAPPNYMPPAPTEVSTQQTTMMLPVWSYPQPMMRAYYPPAYPGYYPQPGYFGQPGYYPPAAPNPMMMMGYRPQPPAVPAYWMPPGY